MIHNDREKGYREVQKNPKSDRWRINPKRHEVPQWREDRKRRRDRERETD